MKSAVAELGTHDYSHLFMKAFSCRVTNLNSPQYPGLAVADTPLL